MPCIHEKGKGWRIPNVPGYSKSEKDCHTRLALIKMKQKMKKKNKK